MNENMKNDLPYAIERGELSVVYQPQWNFDTSKICGAEALLRWDHRKYGSISPNDFIPLAEQIEYITTLGNWVLHVACQDCANWSRQGHTEVVVAINLSASHFDGQQLFGLAQQIIAETQVNPFQLEFEITECVMLPNNPGVARCLDDIKSLGIQIAIDDFGTGHSSLSNLIYFPIDTIKIDRSFIEQLEHNQVNKEIVHAIINLGHNLKKRVVAEGVENKQQFDFLKKHKCDIIQGKIISMPIMANEFMALLAQKTP